MSDLKKHWCLYGARGQDKVAIGSYKTLIIIAYQWNHQFIILEILLTIFHFYYIMEKNT